MKKKEKTIKDAQDLKSTLIEARNALFTLRLDMAVGKLKSTSFLSAKRKEIARILTNMRQEELIHEKA
ncbi:MAG: 50S ribosomal protein L29 [Patescibacteria group bacterium]